MKNNLNIGYVQEREGWMLAQCNDETAEAATAYTCKQVIRAGISQIIIYPDYHVLYINIVGYAI